MSRNTTEYCAMRRTGARRDAFVEDCGVRAYCRFILSCLDERSMNCASRGEERDDGAIPNDTQLKMPTGSLAQIYELRRVFQLCV